MDKAKALKAWEAVSKAREKLDGGELNAEGEEFVARAMAEAEELLAEHAAAERASKLADLSRALEDAALEVPQTKQMTKAREAAEGEEYREAFVKYLRTGDADDEVMVKAAGDLEEGENTEGGYIVPPEFMARLIAKLDPAAPMLGLCSQFNISTNVVELPKLTGMGTADWKAEEAAYHEETIPFDTMSITVHKLTRLQKVSEELLADAAFDVEDIVSRAFGVSFGVAINAALTTGSGTAQPYGYVTRVTNTVTCANGGGWTTDFDPDKLIEMCMAAVPVGYPNRRWVMNQSTWATLAQKKDLDDRYLLLPASLGGLEGSPAGSLIGFPISINPAMADMGVDAKPISFGDHSAHYVVRRPGMTLRRLGELYAATGQVGFLANMRLGADTSIVDEPIVVGVNAAS